VSRTLSCSCNGAEIKLGHKIIRLKNAGELDKREKLKRGPDVVAKDFGRIQLFETTGSAGSLSAR